MKKLAGLIAGAALLLSALPVMAGAKNATYMEWFWNNPETPGEGYKSAYFMKTKSGLVQGWTYEHPDLDNARFIFKPLSKFKNASECDEGWVRENPIWNPQNLYNAYLKLLEVGETGIFWEIFDPGLYLFCAYPME